MGRDVARKIKKDPAGDHVAVRRDATGTVQMSSVASTATTTISNTGNEAVATVDAGEPNLVLHTSATFQIPAAELSATTTPVHLTINRGGSALTSTTHSATTGVTISTSASLTTPANDPSWTFSADVAGGSAQVTWSASREDRWV